MRCFFILALAELGLATLVARFPPAASGMAAFHSCGGEPLDAKKLPGTWRIDALSICDEITGEIREIVDGKVWTLVVSAETKTMSMNVSGVKFYEWAVRHDAKKTPVWIDLTLEFAALDEYPKKKVLNGVLRLEEGKLMIHIGNHARPADFRQGKGLRSLLLKCTREKAK